MSSPSDPDGTGEEDVVNKPTSSGKKRAARTKRGSGTASTTAKRLALETKTVRVRFQEGAETKTYAIQWTELLNTAETPFLSLSELVPGTEVLAPYYSDLGDKINYSLAVIAGRGQKNVKRTPKATSPVKKKKSKEKVQQETNINLSKEVMDILGLSKLGTSSCTSAQLPLSPPNAPNTPTQLPVSPPNVQNTPAQFLLSPPDAQNKPAQFPLSPPDAQNTPAQFSLSPPDAQNTPAQLSLSPPDAQNTPDQFSLSLPDAQNKSAQFPLSPPDAQSTPAQFSLSPSDAKNTPAQFSLSPPDAQNTPAHFPLSPPDAQDMPAQFSLSPPDAQNTPAQFSLSPPDAQNTPAQFPLSPPDAQNTPAQFPLSPPNAQNTPAQFSLSSPNVQNTPAHGQFPLSPPNVQNTLAQFPLSPPNEPKKLAHSLRTSSAFTQPSSSLNQPPIQAQLIPSPESYASSQTHDFSHSTPSSFDMPSMWNFPFRYPYQVDDDNSSVHSSVHSSASQTLELMQAQLDRMERKFDRIITRKKEMHSRSPTPLNQLQSVSAVSATPTPTPTPMPTTPNDGCFLGINPNFQIFIKGLTTQNRTEIEVGAEDDVDLARKLFLAIFKRELSEEPNNVYCTKVDGKKILNPTFLTAIRYHIHFYFKRPASDLMGASEAKRWKSILGKLNDRIRYERRK